MQGQVTWPKGPTVWYEGDTRFISVPFTWNLSAIANTLRTRDLFEKRTVIGGPAVRLMPYFLGDLPNVEVSLGDHPGVLQRVNSQATRTTLGCPRSCDFCGVRLIEPAYSELQEWVPNPIVCDNNILAASPEHFDRVCDSLEPFAWADFNQGLDARLMNDHHVGRFRRIGRVVCRLALDSRYQQADWEGAYRMLCDAGCPKKLIRAYVLVGYNTDPQECWQRCEWVESFGVKPLPMWFHELDAMVPNVVTKKQEDLGWSDYERRRIMQWFYQHKEAVR
jgi:hypothetical protein